ncbi:hypothetical protein [Amycolatopsis sp. WGS_07]|uniref:hypothetical protein n=1 Tax=Amycolatopsis sp. WGS_07 TaxID=3076764 RepID=UPI003873737D
MYRSRTISGQIRAARQSLGFAFLPSRIGDRTDGVRPIPHALARLARVRAVSAAIDGLVRERPLLHRPQ